eukprot:TRINITY_DN650_c0_g1_i13.p1 TRINITY_DN650_c0_g1~~TRINITY_DN650_c0_g1_i13.p1  ORF type:complete len:502 (-),score=228.09 TRINITY_DN650_c0_g1_i13:47-1552(-)
MNFQQMRQFIRENDFESVSKHFHPSLINEKDENGWNLLHLAASYHDNAKMVSFLLNHFDPNSQTNGGTTPLHYTTWNGLDIQGRTAKDYAYTLGLKTIVDLITQRESNKLILPQQHPIDNGKMKEVSLKIWKTKERREKANQLKRLTSKYEELEEKSSAVGLDITSKSNEIAEIEREMEQLNRRKKEAQVVLNGKKEEKERYVKEMKEGEKEMKPLEKRVKEMEERWNENEGIVKKGVEVCSGVELRQLLEGEGVEGSTIAKLEANKVEGSLLLSLDSDMMKNDLELGLKEKLDLIHIVRSWKKREMVDEEEHWDGEKVADWFKQFGFVSAQFIQNLNKFEIDGSMFLEMENNDLKELGMNALGERRQVMNKLEALRSSQGRVSHSEEVRLRNKMDVMEDQFVSRHSEMMEELDRIHRENEKIMKKVKEIPDEFLCPITQEPMSNPVMASDGHTYERAAIEEWFGRRKRTSPMTGADLDDLKLVPNHTVKSMIQGFIEKNK